MEDRLFNISTGRSRQETHWRNRSVSWEDIKGKLSTAVKTPETMAAYRAMTKDQKGKVKDIGGFVGGIVGTEEAGKVVEGRRKAGNVVSRSMVTLDIDYGQPSSIGIIMDVLAGCSWCLYSTHSHTVDTPRYRLIVPLTHNVTPDEYIPIARRLAEEIGIDTFDDSTYEPSRLMYWPSCSSDGEFVYQEGVGDYLDADEVLNTYKDWRDVSEWPVSSRVKVALRPGGKKATDPLLKSGLIGAFCRSYTISEAISSFLSDVYEPTDLPGRYTYLGGTTTGGAIVYDDKYLYSHHGTDPCCEKEVNAFDLVRIHKFGSMDSDASGDTPVNRLPSYKAMTDWVMEDESTTALMAREKLKELEEDFGNLDDHLEPRAGRTPKMDKKGNFVASRDNYNIIFQNDACLRGLVKRDVFHERDIVVGKAPWQRPEKDGFWDDDDDCNLLLYMSQTYGLSSDKQAMLETWQALVSNTGFHPVRDFFRQLPKWDGVPRLDTLLVDYLGAADTRLVRAMTRKHFTAAVARIFNPGTKYDYVLTLVGPEGTGKSTILRKMGREWFSDSFATADIGSKEAMDQLRGVMILELGELKDYKKNTVEAFKQFISKVEDDYRKAYARNKKVCRRQCVFCATTNEYAFLKGDTGNRRFWPVEVAVHKPEKDVFRMTDEEVCLIWSEAVKRYMDKEPLFLSGDLELEAKELQAGHNEIVVDDRLGVIEEFIKTKLPVNWWSMSRRQRRDYFVTESKLAPDEPFIRRQTICAIEIQEECFGVPYDKFRSKEINQILVELGMKDKKTSRVSYHYEDGSPVKDREYGGQSRYEIPLDFYDD